MPLNPALAATAAPPVMAARRWLAEARLPAGLELLNVSQAAPVDPPPAGLRQAMAAAVLDDPGAHLYGPVLGLPDLREAVAARWTSAYGGPVGAAEVAVTAGCNMAFCAALATLAGPGDEVILPSPWYFNHKMWLDMQGVRTRPLACGAGMLPDPAAAAALVTARTRAIVLVTPNNPSGAEYPADLVAAFHALARDRGLALVLDETYRDFDSRPGAPHALFADPDWPRTLVQLYSFSKAYRLTGHRVGTIAAAAPRLAEVEKVLDTVAICAPALGQRAALWGIRHLDPWLAGERAEILARKAATAAAFAGVPGWRLLGCGAYFAWVEHPFAIASDVLCRRLVAEAGILALPGTMFTPADDARGPRELRIAFANVGPAGLAELGRRLAAYVP
ncbi:MAG: aminotransferase [Rhodobacteraceae bacterium]|nr:aminotransferase [Paracoccaceae bacterium]